MDVHLRLFEITTTVSVVLFLYCVFSKPSFLAVSMLMILVLVSAIIGVEGLINAQRKLVGVETPANITIEDNTSPQQVFEKFK